jgi:hypothetical protein
MGVSPCCTLRFALRTPEFARTAGKARGAEDQDVLVDDEVPGLAAGALRMLSSWKNDGRGTRRCPRSPASPADLPRPPRPRRRGDQRKGFTETGYAQLLDAAHQQLGGPLVVVWDNSNTHLSGAMTALIAARTG